MQYNMPSPSVDSQFRDSIRNVPVAKDVPSQHGFPLAEGREFRTQPFADSRNSNPPNGGNVSQETVSIGSKRETPSRQTSTAGQLHKSSIPLSTRDFSSENFVVSRPSAGTDGAQTCIESACSLVASTEQPLTQPVPGILRLSAMSGSSEPNTSKHLIGPCVVNLGDSDYYTDTHEPCPPMQAACTLDV